MKSKSSQIFLWWLDLPASVDLASCAMLGLVFARPLGLRITIVEHGAFFQTISGLAIAALSLTVLATSILVASAVRQSLRDDDYGEVVAALAQVIVVQFTIACSTLLLFPLDVWLSRSAMAGVVVACFLAILASFGRSTWLMYRLMMKS